MKQSGQRTLAAFISQSIWPAAIAQTSLNITVEHLAAVTITTATLAAEYLLGESGVLTLVGIIAVAAWLLYCMNQRSLTTVAV